MIAISAPGCARFQEVDASYGVPFGWVVVAIYEREDVAVTYSGELAQPKKRICYLVAQRDDEAIAQVREEIAVAEVARRELTAANRNLQTEVENLRQEAEQTTKLTNVIRELEAGSRRQADENALLLRKIAAIKRFVGDRDVSDALKEAGLTE